MKGSSQRRVGGCYGTASGSRIRSSSLSIKRQDLNHRRQLGLAGRHLAAPCFGPSTTAAANGVFGQLWAWAQTCFGQQPTVTAAACLGDDCGLQCLGKQTKTAAEDSFGLEQRRLSDKKLHEPNGRFRANVVTVCDWVHGRHQLRGTSPSAACHSRGAAHPHARGDDFDRAFMPVPLAVDAATMLEAFHNTARSCASSASSSRRARSGRRPRSCWPSGLSTRVTAPG